MITTHTETHALVAGVLQTYGSITPQFNNCDVFVDFGAAGLGDLLVQLFAQAGVGAPTVLIASKNIRRTSVNDPQQMIAIPGLGFRAQQDQSIATPGIVGSTTYSLSITSDAAIAALKATISGYDAQVNNQPDEIVTATHPVVQGVETSFGILTNYHIYVQADVDFGVNNTNNGCVFRIYGTAGAGGVRTKLFEKFLSANPAGTGRIQQIIQLPTDMQTVGCDSYELVAVAQNVITGADSSLTCTIVGFDPNQGIGPGPLPPGVSAIGLDFVFQPGGPVPVGATNIYTTEATLWAAVNNALATTGGPLTIAVDSSLGAATYVASHDHKGRVGYTAARPLKTSGFPDILTFADTTLQTRIRSIARLVIILSCATQPALAFTDQDSLFLTEGGQLVNVGAVPACIVPAGTEVIVVEDQNAFITCGPGSELFNLSTATSKVTFQAYENIGTTVEQNLVVGVAGAIFTYRHDTSRATSTPATVTSTFVFLDIADRGGYSTALQPAQLTSQAFVAGGQVTQQQAIGTHISPVNAQSAGYTIDVTGLDQTINATVAALVFTIPAGFPIGRELTFIDSSGGAGANAFTLTPTAPESLGTAGAGVGVSYTQVAVKALTIKKVSATKWRVISSTASV